MSAKRRWRSFRSPSTSSAARISAFSGWWNQHAPSSSMSTVPDATASPSRIGDQIARIPDDFGEFVGVHRAPADGEDLRDPPRRSRELEPRLQDRRAKISREGERRRPRVSRQAGDHQPREVRVAVRPIEDVVHQRLVRDPTEERLDLHHRAVPIEGAEVEFGDPRQAPDIRKPALQRMIQRHLSCAKRCDDGQATVRRTGDDVHERVERAAVRPLQIVDDENHRFLCATLVEPRIEPERELAFISADVGDDLARSGNPSQRGADRQEGDGHGRERKACPEPHRRRRSVTVGA